MSDDATPTSVEEPVESAPVESAPAAEPAAVEAAPDTSADTSTPAAESPPGVDDFGWDDWDGEHSGLPEDISPWAEKVSSYHQKRYDEAISAKDRDYQILSELYNEYMRTGEDPRVAELTTSSKEWEDKYNSINSEFENYRAGIQHQLETDAKEWADTFIAKHQDVLQGENIPKFEAAMAAGWEPEDIVVYLGLPADAQAEADAALKAGAPSNFALKYAQRTVEPPKEAPAPRAAAHIVSGADVGSRPSKSTRGLNDIKSLEERRKLVSERAIRKSRSGRS